MNPYHESNDEDAKEDAAGGQYVPTEAELAQYEEGDDKKKDGGILKRDSDEEPNNHANLNAEWADAPTDFKAIPAPYKEKNGKSVKFQQSGNDNSKKDNKQWKKE